MIFFRSKYKRIIMSVLGFVTIGFGIALMRVIDLGIDPFGAMTLGFSELTGISFGTFLWICHSPVFLIMLWRTRRLIGIGTVLGMFIVGYTIDFFYFVASLTPVLDMEPHIAVRLAALFIALIIFAFGIALYMVADIGTVPYDACGVIIEEATKGKFKFRWARVMMDGICALVAFLLGVTLGIATILTVFCLGPFISFFRGKIELFLPPDISNVNNLRIYPSQRQRGHRGKPPFPSLRVL
ncbi:MAG: hypothetical protein FWC32_00585, partial [Firmicutes bacterium]|nr:hypothetical protein [Bacillota bacterium]